VADAVRAQTDTLAAAMARDEKAEFTPTIKDRSPAPGYKDV